VVELSPLLAALAPTSSRRAVAETVLHNVVGAINVRRAAGTPTVGPEAGPWMDLANALSQLGSDGVISCLRVLLAIATESPSAMTTAQLGAAGQASRRLLDYALAHP